VGPSFPKTYSFVGSRRHDSKVDCFLGSSKETLDVILLLSRNIVQDSPCGGGNRAEKLVRKIVWLRLWRRDATSAILLYMPEMCFTDNNAALLVCSRTARARSSCAATSDVLVLNLYIQATAGRLSHQIETLASCSVAMSTMCSRTSQCSRIPVSSRSDIVRVPVLLAEEQNWALMSWGHLQNHTIGMSCFVPLNHTPPTPHFDASTNP
jgi:hypothetical protein